MKRIRILSFTLCVLLLACGCSAPEPTPTPEPTPELTPAPTPEPTPEPTPVLLEPVEYEMHSGECIEDDFDGDGTADSIAFSSENEATFEVTTSSCGSFSCTLPIPPMYDWGYVLGLDMGEGAYTWIFSAPRGLNGGAGAISAAVYRLQDGQYVCFMEELPSQRFTGEVGSDGKSVTIESVTGLVQEGTLTEGACDIIANTTLETDPICDVSWVYEAEAGRYDIVLNQYVYSSAMHIAGVAMCHTQYCIENGELTVVRQWADLW